MALFSKKTWKDMIAQFPNRRKIIDTSTGQESQVEVFLDLGKITESGAKWSATELNDLENRIEDGFNNVINEIAPYAESAEISATEAEKQKTLATNAATIAEGNAQITSRDKTDSQNAALSAGQSATNANASASSAFTSETNAKQHANAAQQSALDAEEAKQYIIDHKEDLIGSPGVIWSETEPTLPEDRAPIWINPTGTTITIPFSGAEIDDNAITKDTTWSSTKINEIIGTPIKEEDLDGETIYKGADDKIHALDSVVTTNKSGLMSNTDKAKLDSINSVNLVYGTCATVASAQVKVINFLDTNYQVKDNDILIVHYSNTNSFSASAAGYVQLEISGNIYEIYTNMNNGRTTGTNTSYYGLADEFIYYLLDVTNKKAIWMGHSRDNNTTYTPPSVGSGYGTCKTAETTTAKIVTLSNYTIQLGGIVAVKFTYKVPANSTLNINNKGAKAIYRNGSAITAGKIGAGDTAVFVYNGAQYELIATSSYGTQDNDTTAASSLTCTSAPYGGETNVTKVQDALNNLATAIGKGGFDFVSGTLSVGDTELILTSSAIKEDSIVDPYYWATSGAEIEPISYSTIKVENGKVTMTFDALDSNLQVGIRVI